MRAYKKCMPYNLFGKALKDFTLEEKKEYYRIKARNYYEKHCKKFVHENSFIRQKYGQNKRVRTLSAEERKEYNRIKQRECRAKKKGN